MKDSLQTLEREIARAQQFSMRVNRRRAPRNRGSLAASLAPSPASRAFTSFAWDQYFPFAAGTHYEVDGPLGYDGRGAVLTNSGNVLAFTLDMPKYVKIPKAQVQLEITFLQPGAGNLVRATVGGTTYEDPGAIIEIDEASGTATIRSTRAIPGFALEWVRFRPESADEIDVDVRLDGREHDFDFKRTAAGTAIELGTTGSLVRAQSGVEAAALGYSVVRDIADNEGDISWELKALDGSYHPHHDLWTKEEHEKYGTGSWQTRKEKVHAAMTTRIGAEISATFELSFQYNGHYIANVDVEPIGTNDLVLWGLRVQGRLVKDASEFWHPETGAGPFAHVSYVFNYRFSGSMWEDKIFVARYELYGDGQLAWNREWKQ